jgi:phosphohistidine phosphatase SixA
MVIWLVRHGLAGRKKDWKGDDDLRPLDRRGRLQAEGVADVLAPRRPRRLLASPTSRCTATLAPLGRRLGLPVIDHGGLRVGGRPGDLLDLLAEEAVAGDVLCTHGELLRPALRQLRRCGAVDGRDEEAHLLAKGAVWEVDLERPALTLLRPT